MARGDAAGLRGVMVLHVAEHQRGLLEPGTCAQRREVGLHDEVAIALRPARRLVAGHRLHVDVVGQQVVAAMRLVMRAIRRNTAPGSACRSGGPACRPHRPAPCRSRPIATAVFKLVEGQVSGHFASSLSHFAQGMHCTWKDRPPEGQPAVLHVSSGGFADCLFGSGDCRLARLAISSPIGGPWKRRFSNTNQIDQRQHDEADGDRAAPSRSAAGCR